MKIDSYKIDRYWFLKISILLIFNVNVLFAQCTYTSSDSIQIVFYNVENLFDVFDDPKTEDEEFTSQGLRKWNEVKYKRKINHLSQSILSLTSYQTPEIIGLCEIENREVIKDLVNVQLFKQSPYKIIHNNSRDRRGIDMGLIYDSTKINPLFIQFIPVQLKNENYSRELLYLKVLINSDSLHLFVNHWPSRYAGTRDSDASRMIASRLLVVKCDSIIEKNINAKIIIMGDFNDEPSDRSLLHLTDYKIEGSEGHAFCNLMADIINSKGTIKYQGQWFVFDQFIVTANLLNPNMNLSVRYTEIAMQQFLFEKDLKYLGRKPFRTYNGFRYLGGFSDHLPIKLILNVKK